MAQTQSNGTTFWERTKGYSSTAYNKALKPGFNKAYAVVDKLGAPINRLSNKVGSEAFWPTTLDKESEKAARILRSFCKDGFYNVEDVDEAKKSDTNSASRDGVPQGKQRVLMKIPEKVIREAKGLAIFTTLRTGWLFGGSGGAGVLIARHPETGEWSPPSGIMTQNLSIGFLIGVDIYDTVLIINTWKALDAFTKLRCTLGTEVGVAAGPVGIGGSLDTEIHKRQAPVWSYVKSRGFYAGVALEGNLVIERTDENEKFYGERVGVSDILIGKVRHPPVDKYSILMNTVKAAQGEQVDESLLPSAGEAPSDMEIESNSFGIPDVDDPDPYGVKALEAEGLKIREAGTHQRPTPDAFDFNPAPSSPIYGHFSRKSVDGSIKSRPWRSSTLSISSIDRGTQTEDDEPQSGHQSPKVELPRRVSPPRKESQHVDEGEVKEDEDDDDFHDSLSDVDEEVEIQTATQVVAKAKVVTLPKRVPPALPPRNPGRINSSMEQDETGDGFDKVSLDDSTIDRPASRVEEPSHQPDVSKEEEEQKPLSEKTDTPDHIQGATTA